MGLFSSSRFLCRCRGGGAIRGGLAELYTFQVVSSGALSVIRVRRTACWALWALAMLKTEVHLMGCAGVVGLYQQAGLAVGVHLVQHVVAAPVLAGDAVAAGVTELKQVELYTFQVVSSGALSVIRVRRTACWALWALAMLKVL